MPSKKKADTTTFDTSALDALDPAILADRQRIVDLAVRKARSDGYCDVVEAFLTEIMPEFGVASVNQYDEPFMRFYASDGIDCRHQGLVPTANQYDENGYDSQGYDRDGWYRARNKDGRNGYRPGRPATAEETAAEAAALAAAVNPTTYKPTA